MLLSRAGLQPFSLPWLSGHAELKKSKRDDACVKCFSRQQVETQCNVYFHNSFSHNTECHDRRFDWFSYSTVSSEILSLPLFWRIKHQLYGRAGSLKFNICDSDRSLLTSNGRGTPAFLCRNFKQAYSLPCPICYHILSTFSRVMKTCVSTESYLHILIFWTNFHFSPWSFRHFFNTDL